MTVAAVDVSSDALSALLGLLARHTGFSLSGDRAQRALVAIQEAMAARGIVDGLAYLRLIQGDPLAFDSLVGEILVGETYFQREPQQWKLMRQTILADITRRCPASHVIRCWSAGCASGEEAYSLAILLAEAGLADRARVVGTDISRVALARARAASYGAWSLRVASPEFTGRWLRQCGDRHFVIDDIRGRVEFAHLNLVTEDDPSTGAGIGLQDLILCRNVLIYFDRDTTARVVQKLYAALAPGGWLVCGSSDPSPAAHAPFRAVHTAEGIAYQRPPGADGVRPEPPTELQAAPIEPAREPLRGATGSRAELRGRASGRTVHRAAAAAAAAAIRAELDPEPHYLRAMRLIDLGRLDDAMIALRSAIYLDRELAVAHFALGAVLERLGQPSRAARAYRNAAAIAARQPADEPAALAEGESHRALAAAARVCSARLAAGVHRGQR